MLIDLIKEELKNLHPDLQAIHACWEQSNYQTDFEELTAATSKEDFWQHPKQAAILKKLQMLRTLREQYLQITQSMEEYPELAELFVNDEHELANIHAAIKKTRAEILKLKITFLLSGEDDNKNCFLSINSGAGGTESQDWAAMLLRMYLRFCERSSFKMQILDYQAGEEAGIKSATLLIQGTNVYGLLKNEDGVHRLVRISPFDANKRRHTSFAAIAVTPEVESAEIEIDPNDLRIDTYRASGAGGQHVNKTESAIRITHLPTNIVVQCQNERSQVQNKENALKMLKAKLVQRQKDEEKRKQESVERKSIEWGSQIRSYVLQPYKMVKDHRTELESPQPENVLDGDILPFIEANLIRAQGAS